MGRNKMKKTDFLEIKELPFLKLMHRGQEILFHHDIVEISKLQEKGLKRPTLGELVSLMYAGFSSAEDNVYIKNLKYYFSKSMHIISSTYLYSPFLYSGGIIFDNPGFDKDNKIILELKKLASNLIYEPREIRVFRGDIEDKKNHEKLVKLLVGEDDFLKLEDKSVFEAGWDIFVEVNNNERFEIKERILCAYLQYSDKIKKARIFLENYERNYGETFGKYNY
jgi:hypothetical protein